MKYFISALITVFIPFIQVGHPLLRGCKLSWDGPNRLSSLQQTYLPPFGMTSMLVEVGPHQLEPPTNQVEAFASYVTGASPKGTSSIHDILNAPPCFCHQLSLKLKGATIEVVDEVTIFRGASSGCWLVWWKIKNPLRSLTILFWSIVSCEMSNPYWRYPKIYSIVASCGRLCLAYRGEPMLPFAKSFLFL